MVEVINKYFLEDDKFGVIRVTSNRLLSTDGLTDRDQQIIAYIGFVASINLVDTNSGSEFIMDHKPGKETLDVIAYLSCDVINPYIQALFFDILQCNKVNKFKNAKSAIETYLRICENRESLSSKRDYYVRIINILKGLGGGNKVLLPIYIETIKQDILSTEISEECFSVTMLTKELVDLKFDSSELEPFISKVENGTSVFQNKLDFRAYRQCHEVF